MLCSAGMDGTLKVWDVGVAENEMQVLRSETKLSFPWFNLFHKEKAENLKKKKKKIFRSFTRKKAKKTKNCVITGELPGGRFHLKLQLHGHQHPGHRSAGCREQYERILTP